MIRYFSANASATARQALIFCGNESDACAGAGRRQAGKVQAAIGKLRPHVSVKTVLGLRAVEEHVLHSCMSIEERVEIIRHDRRFVNVRVKASLPHARGQHVPYRQAGTQQDQDALFIGHRGARPEQFAHDEPERVVAMGVIPSREQRRGARHAAEYEHSGRAVFDRRKTTHR